MHDLTRYMYRSFSPANALIIVLCETYFCMFSLFRSLLVSVRNFNNPKSYIRAEQPTRSRCFLVKYVSIVLSI